MIHSRVDMLRQRAGLPQTTCWWQLAAGWTRRSPWCPIATRQRCRHQLQVHALYSPVQPHRHHLILLQSLL